MERRGHSFCRYADDCNIYVGSRKAGERVMETIVKFIEKKLKLKVNRSKSGVKHCSEVKFLGYTILTGGGIRVADKAIDRFKDKVRTITKRNRGVKFEQVIKELNTVLVGWSNYFKLANSWLWKFQGIRWMDTQETKVLPSKAMRKEIHNSKVLAKLRMPERKAGM